MNKEQMNKQVFKCKREAVDHCAVQVARFWLECAEAIIRRGDTPAAFSRLDSNGVPYGQRLVREELDRPIYNRFRRFMDSESIFLQARREACAWMKLGEFPLVNAFNFKPQFRKLCNLPPAVQVAAAPCN